MRTDFLCISVLKVASGPRVKLASCKSALKRCGVRLWHSLDFSLTFFSTVSL